MRDFASAGRDTEGQFPEFRLQEQNESGFSARNGASSSRDDLWHRQADVLERQDPNYRRVNFCRQGLGCTGNLTGADVR